MRLKTDRDKLVFCLGVGLGTAWVALYLGFLAAFTGLVEFNPWMTFLVSGETGITLMGFSMLAVVLTVYFLVPDEDLDAGDSSTRVDA